MFICGHCEALQKNPHRAMNIYQGRNYIILHLNLLSLGETINCNSIFSCDVSYQTLNSSLSTLVLVKTNLRMYRKIITIKTANRV